IPTDKGYRIYVDSLMELQKLRKKEIGIIEKSLKQSETDTDELLRLTSKLFSNITRQLAAVTYPKVDSGTLEKIQIVSLSSTRILVVISIDSGLVKTITLEQQTELKPSQIDSVQRLLNERLSGLSLKDIRKTFKERFKDVPEDHKSIMRLFIDSADKIFKDIRSTNKVLISGAKDVIRQPEFDIPERFQSVIELIEDQDVIIHILEKGGESRSDQVYISIGSENEDQKLQDYSSISKEYKIGNISGTLGVIGPKRMEYSKVVAIVDYVSKLLSEVLTNVNTK
ncbi:MAG TPA: heat-inducible transcriptional repressor HrcA, partial [Ignavibacteriaceae bacterium]|nr:heat-inducible transcriptional repressor HrcA [Ignavibacteriaceae bacterium]